MFRIYFVFPGARDSLLIHELDLRRTISRTRPGRGTHKSHRHLTHSVGSTQAGCTRSRIVYRKVDHSHKSRLHSHSVVSALVNGCIEGCSSPPHWTACKKNRGGEDVWRIGRRDSSLSRRWAMGAHCMQNMATPPGVSLSDCDSVPSLLKKRGGVELPFRM